MNSLLDLPGPLFIAAYVVLWVVATKLGPLCQRVCASTRRRGAPSGRALSLHEIAQLAGGEARAIDTALTVLAQRGLVQAQPSGRGLMASASPGDGLGPVDTDVLAAALRDGGRPQRSIRSLLTSEQQLMRTGLLHTPGSAALRCLRWAANAPLFALLALGLAKVLVGMSRDRPVGLLVVLVVATVGMMVLRRGHLPTRTGHGDAVLDGLRQRNAALKTTLMRRGAQVSDADMALGVALFGLSVLSSSPLSWLPVALTPWPADTGTSGGSDSGNGDSGGSSCSSGGGSSCGGGGGCGGCGS